MAFHHTQNKIQRHLPLCNLAPGCFPPSPFTTLPHHHALQTSSLLTGTFRAMVALCLECPSLGYLHPDLCSNITSPGKTS